MRLAALPLTSASRAASFHLFIVSPGANGSRRTDRDAGESYGSPATSEAGAGFRRSLARTVLILVTGARGFIGSALTTALRARGHAVRAGVRGHAARVEASRVAVDFARDVDSSTWVPRLVGVDAVVNTVGILREHGEQTFERVHVATPRALFGACASLGIARVVQLSALGADASAVSAYHRSKREADDALAERVPTGWSAQPSLVYGAGGASARLFDLLASLPLLPVPGRGTQRIQPIHVDDLVDALCALVERPPARGGRIALVGPEPLALRDYLAALRSGMQLSPTQALPLPEPVVRIAARAGGLSRQALLDRDTLAMLERGNVADAAATAALLGRAPRPAAAFIAPREAAAARTQARLAWLLPLLRVSVAIVWIVTGIVSLGVYPVDASYALLGRVGVPPALRPLMLYGAASLDLVLGALVFVLAADARRWLWRTQAALIVVYSALIAWRLPGFWIHPYGPMLKNIPLLAGLVLLDTLEPTERTRWTAP